MKTILLLDDDDCIREVYGLALRSRGYHVIVASTGDEGMELAKTHLPDLILTDINMPGSDGRNVLKSIREHPELRTKQVVLMTGHSNLVTPRRGMELGADDFLVKPVTLNELLHCVEARLARAQVHSRVENEMLSTLRVTLHSTLPHELFTPLGGIIGLVELLQADYANLPPDEVGELLHDIHFSALGLHRTLRNYLLIFDLAAPVQEGTPAAETLSPRRLKEALQSAVRAAVSRHDREKDVFIRIYDRPLVGIANDINLIAEELVDNACKFSPKGTEIDIDFDPDGVLSVRDHGRGMSAEQIAQIGSFQQFDRKKYEQQGLGLGLALVQKLAARCGGVLTIKSQPSQGTVVRVAFKPGA